jgi:hypothetical protein
MTHTEALRLQAAEKYLLNELTKEEREAYEDHYFDCTACTEELKATVAFMDSSRQLFREGAFEPEQVPARKLEPAPAPAPTKGDWFAWLKPAFAVTAFAAVLLLTFIGYQNSVTIPNLKQASAQSASAKVVNSFSFMALGARGENVLDINVGAKEDFALEVDFPPVTSASGYVGQIQDGSGNVKYSLPVSLEQAKSTVHISVPGGSLPSGKYNFVIFAEDSGSQASSLKEIKRLPFTVEIKQ